MQKLIAVLALAALTACGAATDQINSDATPAKLQKSTAQFFGTSTRNVSVGSLKPSLVGTAYKARVGRVMHDCKYFRGVVTCEPTR